MARKRYQKGSLFVRGTGRKVYVLRYYENVLLPDHSLGRTRRSVVLGPVNEVGSKREAWKMTEHVLREVNQGRQRPNSSITFGELARQWEENILPLKKASTQAFYRDVIYRHLLPAFSNKRLCDLVRAEIQGFITAETQRYAWSTVQGIRVTLNLILDQALDWDYLSENPARSIKMPRRPNRPDLVVLSLAEIGRLLQELKEPYQTMVSMAVLTGKIGRAHV